MQQPLSKKYPNRSLAETPSDKIPADARVNYAGASGMVGLITPNPIHLSSLSTWLDFQVWPARTWTHGIVILLAIGAILLSNLPLSWGGGRALRPIKSVTAQPTPPVDSPDTAQAGTPLTLPGQLSDLQDDVLVAAAVPHTIIPERAREQISRYIVEPGDTIYGIAFRFGLDPETVIWSNPDLEKAPDVLSVGQELAILPVNGIYHQVGQGDTIESIASTFKSDPAAIVAYPLNELDPDQPVITPGQWLVVPGGSKPFIPRTVMAYSGPIPEGANAGSGSFAWPASGNIYQGYFAWHPAIDIASYVGAPALAADSGYVIVSGWDNSGYGNQVVIDHGNGYQTLYAHLNAIYVNAGENVAQGQQIGEVGITGNATGPHLHFEIRQSTVQRNPMGFLP
jgi:murein DD-endopeptidase MepM/ murein hydrolase activator NlpD